MTKPKYSNGGAYGERVNVPVDLKIILLLIPHGPSTRHGHWRGSVDLHIISYIFEMSATCWLIQSELSPV